MPSADHSRLKVHLKMCVSRLRLLQQKKSAIAKQQRRELANLLQIGKDESARIRVEMLIREDINVELMEILELYCELLLARIGLLEQRECDPGLEEAIKSLIYAAPRSEVKELLTVRQMFVHKFGKQFELDAAENRDQKVNEKVIKKLGVTPPPTDLVDRYLKEIARTYHIKWTGIASASDDEADDDDEPATGALPDLADNLPSTPWPGSTHPIQAAPPSPSTENPRPKLNLSNTINSNKSGNLPRPNQATVAAAPINETNDDDDDNSFDALMARFEKLKKV